MANSTSNQHMEYLRARSTGAVASSVLSRGLIMATRLTSDLPGHGHVGDHLKEDAFMISVQMRDYEGELWVDGKRVDFAGSRKGNFTLYDYTRAWEANLVSAFDCINYHFPRSAFTALEEDLGTRRIGSLNVAPGRDVDDHIVRSLTEALFPALRNPEQTSRLFADHVGLALSMHLATRYGDAAASAAVSTGVLAPWQLRRATALMDSKLDGDLSVAEIANVCRLSPSYFARAFKQTTGITPYKWILQRRVDKAMSLMRSTGLPLRQIAYDCGFADQSHLTRIFTKNVGLAPASWRKGLRS